MSYKFGNYCEFIAHLLIQSHKISCSYTPYNKTVWQHIGFELYAKIIG